MRTLQPFRIADVGLASWYVLRVAGNGDIHAEGLDELLYGRLSNVL